MLLRKRGAVVATALRSRPVAEKTAICASVVEHVWPLVADGTVKPIVHVRLPLAEAGEAHRVVEASESVGKVLLTTRAVGWPHERDLRSAHAPPTRTRSWWSAPTASRSARCRRACWPRPGIDLGLGRRRRRRPRRRRALGRRHGRAARQGDADRQHDPPAARGGEGGPARRGQPQPAQGDPPGLDQGARGRPGARAGRGARAALAAVHRRLARPSEGELRIAQAQLVGWLEGLFHGIQTAIYAQQMAARVQLEQMRRQLPPGMSVRRAAPGVDGHGDAGAAASSGRVRRHVPLTPPSRRRRQSRAAARRTTTRPSSPTSTSAMPGAAMPGERSPARRPRRG